MYEYLPIIIIVAIVGSFTILFILADIALKRVKKETSKERTMEDKELVARLLRYAKPYKKQFAFVFLTMVISIIYDLVAPLMIGGVEELIKEQFELRELYVKVAIYASILAISMLCTYLQTLTLQKVGQKILSALREDIFHHIEELSHEQLNNIPVGKLVTRVTNDTEAISMMFTNVLVTLAKNSMVVVGVLGAMLMLNYGLTLIIVAFAPFVVLFTVIFRRFSREAHRKVNDARTDINTYLSENLSGMKITQIFNQEENKMQDFLARSKQLEKAKMQQIFVFGVFRPMVYLLRISTTLCLLYFGAKGYIKDTTLF